MPMDAFLNGYSIKENILGYNMIAKNYNASTLPLPSARSGTKKLW